MKWLEIAKDGWQALGVGRVVADPAAWKKHQVSVNQVAALMGFLLAMAKVAGYDLRMDDSTQMYIAGGIFGGLNWVFTVVTTDKIGAMGQRAPVDVVVGPGPSGNVASSVGATPGAPVGGVTAVAGTTDPVRRGSDDPAQSNPYAGGA